MNSIPFEQNNMFFFVLQNATNLINEEFVDMKLTTSLVGGSKWSPLNAWTASIFESPVGERSDVTSVIAVFFCLFEEFDLGEHHWKTKKILEVYNKEKQSKITNF